MEIKLQKRYKNAGDILNKIKDADVVKVVRCKDCKFGKSDTPYCQENGEIYCEFDNLIKFKNHFCSFGERREV